MFNPFWNPEERRVRSFWRILIQGLLFIFLTTLLSGLVFAAGGAFLGTTGALPGATADSFSDPAFMAQVIQALENSPVVDVFSRLAYLASMLISVWFAARFLDRRRFASYGFHFNAGWWGDFAFGLALGGVLMLLIFLFELAMGWVTVRGTFQAESGSFAVRIGAAFIAFIVVGIVEELLSRGYQLRNLAEGLNLSFLSPRTALLLSYLITSWIFGLLHLGNPNATLTSTINLILAGLFLGLAYVLTGELAIPIGLHISWNFFQGNVFGFPVSGMTTGVTFIDIEQGGPMLWTGGPFGPEAGLTGLLAMLVGSLLIILWVRSRRQKAALQDEIAQYPGAEGPAVAKQDELLEAG